MTSSRRPSRSRPGRRRASAAVGPAQHEDAGVVVADAELAGRADHPVGHVAVGLARGDREAAGQHRAGQRRRRRGRRRRSCGRRRRSRAAPSRRRRSRPGTSGSSCRSSAARRRLEHPADDERALDVGAGVVQRLELRARARSAGAATSRGGTSAGQVDVLAQPGQGRPHQISVPKAAVNRTSPSTMSRMSSTPCRNISVRSMPMPNAKPV